eukprot:122684-Pyramimonas_sp.AAC.1
MDQTNASDDSQLIPVIMSSVAALQLELSKKNDNAYQDDSKQPIPPRRFFAELFTRSSCDQDDERK